MTSSAPPAACYDWARTFSLHPRRRRQCPCLTAEPVVIDYETSCKIHDCHDRQGLTIAQTARALGLHPQTVATWLARSRFAPDLVAAPRQNYRHLPRPVKRRLQLLLVDQTHQFKIGGAHRLRLAIHGGTRQPQ